MFLNNYLVNIIRYTAESEPVKNIDGIELKFCTPSLVAVANGYSLSNECFTTSFDEAVKKKFLIKIPKKDYKNMFHPKSNLPNLLGHYNAIYVLTDRGKEFREICIQLSSILLN